MRHDVLAFLLLAFVVYCAGLAVCAWDLVRHPENLETLPVLSFVGFVLAVIGLVPNLVPVAILLAGGYAARTEDTVTVHVNTYKVAAGLL